MISQNNIHVGGYRHVVPQHILRLEAYRNYTFFHSIQGGKFIVSTTLKIFEERLFPFGFIRVSRQDMINTYYIKKVWKDGAIELIDGTLTYPSRRRRQEIWKVLNQTEKWKNSTR